MNKPPTRRLFLTGLSAAALAAPSARALAAVPRASSRKAARKPSASPTARPTARPTVNKARVSRAIRRQAQKHVMRPAHVAAARSEIGLSKSQLKITRAPAGWVPTVKPGPRLDLASFGPALHEKLASKVNGYAIQIRRGGTVVHNGHWEWSRTPVNGGHGWSLDTRMHIASVSKLFTAMAMVNCLNFRNQDVDDRIRDWLPDYWAQGPGVDQLTCRHLLTHRSGFSATGSDSDFAFMRDNVAQGVAGMLGQYAYHNMNFGLCRILIPVLFGWIDPSDTHGDATDHIWDVRTILRFAEFCNTRLFAPAGVPTVSFAPDGNGALAYSVPHGGTSGWNSGDLATVAGGVGFRMSVREVLDVMGAFRRSGTIIPTGQVQSFLDSWLGIDQIIDTPAGRLYNKNGAWVSGSRMEQCVAYFLPDDMELVMFVNSPIEGDLSLRGTIADTFVESLK